MRTVQPHEAEFFGRRMEVLANANAFQEMRQAIDNLQAELGEGHPFEGFSKVEELPLYLSEMEPRLLGVLAARNIVTISDLRKWNDERLLELPLVGPKQVSILRAEVEVLIGRYVAWVVERD